MNCTKTKSPTLTRPDPNLGFIGESKEMYVLVSATKKTILTSYIASTIQQKRMTYVMLVEVICERLDGTCTVLGTRLISKDDGATILLSSAQFSMQNMHSNTATTVSGESFRVLLPASLRSILSKVSSVLLLFGQNLLTLLIGRGRLLGTRV
jgi:hypothetical protein